MRQKIRCFLLWLKKELIIVTNMCEHCGRRGAAPCSVAGLKKLCDGCATEACQGYSIIKPSPSVESLDYIEEEEEYPNFDYYPASAPKDLVFKGRVCSRNGHTWNTNIVEVVKKKESSL